MALDRQTETLLARWRAQDTVPSVLTVPQARARLKAMFQEFDISATPVARQEERRIPVDGGHAPVRIYWPQTPSGLELLPALLWFHGGGWTCGDMESQENICRFLCAHGRSIVVNVEYRLAPEHKFPTGVEDCYTVLRWAADAAEWLGIDIARIAVAGPSAGGALTIVMCLLAKARSGPKIAYQIPIYPCFTLAANHGYESRKKFGGGEFGLTEAEIGWLRGCYLSSEDDALDYRASPKLFGDFKNLPPALIITAGNDPVVDDGKDYAEHLRRAGVSVEYECFELNIHGFLEIAGAIDAGKVALELIASRLRTYLAVR